MLVVMETFVSSADVAFQPAIVVCTQELDGSVSLSLSLSLSLFSLCLFILFVHKCDILLDGTLSDL